MPEKEQLIVYLHADSADLAILERLEFHQINSIVFLLGAGATVLFAILYWLLKKWIYSKSA
jgi:hypothetical protein